MLDRLDHSTHQWPLLPSHVEPKPESTVNLNSSKLQSKTSAKVQPFWLEDNINKSQVSDNMDSLIEPRQPSSRPTSSRLSGIRGHLLSRQASEPCLHGITLDNGHRSSSRPVSTRMSGIRGELLSRQSSEGAQFNPLSSMSDSSLMDTNNHHHMVEENDSGVSSEMENKYQPRSKTATLAKGRRPLAKTDGLVTDGIVIADNSSDFSVPVITHNESEVNSTHLHSEQPIVRQSLDECLASISKFDHSHMGQIGADMQGITIYLRC